MALDHILLGLARTPASGYDIKARFREVFSHFWNAELPQIYRTLKRLEADGLVRGHSEASTKGPDKRVYETTRKGHAALRAWLAAGPEFGNERLSYLAQVFFLDALGDAARSRAFLEALLERLRGELAALAAIEQQWAAQDPRFPDALPDADFHAHLTLRLGLRKLEAIVAWATECIERVARREGNR